jgi:outer membrane lipoprotein SlyB
VCGQVRSVREVSAAARPADTAARAQQAVGSASALDTAPVVGTVARFEFDSGRPNSWHLGAVGTPEMRQRLGETYYEVTVVMDGGERRSVQRRDGNRFYVGQRVALRSGELEPM